MKNTMIVIAAILLVVTACNNADKTPAVTDSLNRTPGTIDTVKIDTVKPTDSIIKG